MIASLLATALAACAFACGRSVLDAPQEVGGAGGAGGLSIGGAGGTGGPSVGGARGAATGACSSVDVGDVVWLSAPGNQLGVWTGREYVTTWIESGSAGTPDTRGFRHYSLARLATDVAGKVLLHSFPYVHETIVSSDTPATVGTAVLLAAGAGADGVAVLWCATESDATDGRRAMFARVAADGASTTTPAAIGPCGWQGGGSLAWNGAGFGAAWDCGSGNLCFTRLDANGAALQAALQVPSSGILDAWSLKLLWNGHGYAMVWNESDQIRGENRFLAFSASGAATGGAVALNDPNQIYAKPLLFSRSSSGYLAAWDQSTTAPNPTGATALVFADLDDQGALVGSLRPLADSTSSALEYDGQAHAALIADQTTSDYSFVTFAPGAEPTGPGTPVVSRTATSRWSLIWNGTGYGLFWTDSSGVTIALGYRSIACRQ